MESADISNSEPYLKIPYDPIPGQILNIWIDFR